MAAAACGLALLVPAAMAQVPAVELPAVPDIGAKAVAAPATAAQSAIPHQYHAIAAAAEQSLPAIPAAPSAPAPIATGAPKEAAAHEYRPAHHRYHSEPPAD